MSGVKDRRVEMLHSVCAQVGTLPVNLLILRPAQKGVSGRGIM